MGICRCGTNMHVLHAGWAGLPVCGLPYFHLRYQAAKQELTAICMIILYNHPILSINAEE